MKFHIVRPHELSPEVLSDWQRIQSSDPIYQSPFYSHHFTCAVGQTRQDAFVAVIEADGMNVGFLPFHRTRGGVAKPIGGPINDYQGPILSQDANIAPDQLLAGCKLTAYDYNHLPVAMGSFAADAYDFSASPHLDLSEGYDTFVENRGSAWSKAQREARRRRRKTEADIGPLKFEFDDKSDASYRRHVEMKNKLFVKLGVKSILKVKWVADTLDIIRKIDEPDFSGMMTTLHAGEKLIAAHFGMKCGDVWHYWFPSYDLSFSKLGPGIALLNDATQRAEARGIRIIDFGRGELDYKILFSNGSTELCEGSFVRGRTPAGVLRRGERAFLNSIRPLPLGRYESYPRRIMSRLISGVVLPEG